MERITNYRENEDGTFSVIVQGVKLGDDETLLLDNGMSVGVDINIHNPYKITVPQRKLIFALTNDIEEHTGTPSEYMRAKFQKYVELIHGYENKISLSNCSKQTASRVIDVAMAWIFKEGIPLNYNTSDLLKGDKGFLYLATINRKCVICGAHADLAHRDAVGSGRNRRTIEHYDNKVLALCRRHHTEQHQIGVDTFDSKYHLTNSWLKVNDKLNKMLKGQKVN